jgi:hypothetical protein
MFNFALLFPLKSSFPSAILRKVNITDREWKQNNKLGGFSQ